MFVFLRDIRYFQILVMGSLLAAGVFTYDFSLQGAQIMLTFLAGGLAQGLWLKKKGLSFSSLLSATISCLGVALLMRSSNLWAHPLVAVVAISSKYLLQINGRHFQNPSAFAIVLALFFLPEVWISPGQWGTGLSIALWLFALGFLISARAKQIDISWLFLLFYLSGVFFRNLYLEYEFAIFLHSASNGALILFAFFMISDPRTSPDHILGKVAQALFVSLASLLLHYYFFVTNGFIYSLVISSFFVPWINQILPATPFNWRINEKQSSFAH